MSGQVHWNAREPYARRCTNIVVKSVAQGVRGFGRVPCTEAELQDLNSGINHFEKILVDTLGRHFSNGLFTLKFHVYTMLLKISVGFTRSVL